MPGPERTLRIAFSDADAFWAEYNANLCNAGVFVATAESFEQRETVRVEIAQVIDHKRRQNTAVLQSFQS